MACSALIRCCLLSSSLSIKGFATRESTARVARLHDGGTSSDFPDRPALRQQPYVGAAGGGPAVPFWLDRLCGAVAAGCLLPGLDRGASDGDHRQARDRGDRKQESRERSVRPGGRRVN